MVILGSISEETIAFHEAGHAVAMRALHFAIREVSIVADGDSVGRVVPRSPLQPFAWRVELFDLQTSRIRNKRRDSLELALRLHRSRCRNMLSVILAGPLAAAKLTESDKPYKDDSDKKQLAFCLSELGTSTALQLRLRFEEADGRAVKILEAFWPDVKLIATELRRRKTVSGSAVKRLVENARAELLSSID
jgi:hypothetical protein